jgi:hypothetical protein
MWLFWVKGQGLRIALYFLDILVPQIRKWQHRNPNVNDGGKGPQAGHSRSKSDEEETDIIPERDDLIYMPNNKTWWQEDEESSFKVRIFSFLFFLVRKFMFTFGFELV